MSIPAVGLSINCTSECTQCCPDKISIFCCCCKVESDSPETRTEKALMGRVNKREAQPEIESTKDDGRLQYVCVHRTDEVAIASMKRHTPIEGQPGCGCTIL